MKVTVTLERDPTKNGAWSELEAKLAASGIDVKHTMKTGKRGSFEFEIDEETLNSIIITVEPVT